MSESQGPRPGQGQPLYQPSYPRQGYLQQGDPQRGGQPYQGQPYQGQPYQGQPYQGQPYQGQPYQGQPGYRPSGPAGGPPRRSPLLLIGIVVAAVVALVAIGGIVIGLSSGSRDVPETAITPAPQTPPPDLPSSDPSSAPSADPGSSPSSGSTAGGSGGAGLDLGHDVTLVPATGWDVKKQTETLAQLSDGRGVYVGQTAALEAGSNPGQVCTAWHKQLAESEGGGRFEAPKAVDVGSKKLRAASCSAQITASSGQGSSELLLVSVVSVRSTDGITVVATVAYDAASDQDELQTDVTSMTSSMLQTQAAG